MKESGNFEFDDVQGLLRFGYGKLADTCFMLLKIADASAARQWLSTAPVSSAIAIHPPPDTALQIAFSVQGLRALGIDESIIDGFSDEFVHGMTRNENCSRRSVILDTMRRSTGNGGRVQTYRISCYCFMPERGGLMPGKQR